MKKYDWFFLKALAITIVGCAVAMVIDHFFGRTGVFVALIVAALGCFWWIDRPSNPDCPYCEYDHTPVAKRGECPWTYR